MTVRVRFAPSPTGYLHIGGARTALFNWMFARKHGGKFILRIEDTDQKRYVEGAVEAIKDGLTWLGIDWDEGPDKGGSFGPYVQTMRSSLYLTWANRLLDMGHAYKCFCSAEELDEMRKEQTEKKLPLGYDRRCRILTEEEIKKRENETDGFVIRFKMPMDGTTVVKDMIRGEIPYENKQINDAVLLKSDGLPTYHLANVIDDHFMEITHIMRADEWINTAPLHIHLYQAFGWDMPDYAHLPLVMNPSGKGKLSKRSQGFDDSGTEVLVRVDEFEKAGMLPEAVVNFLANVGWNFGEDQEKFTMEEAIPKFNLEDINPAPSQLPYSKLDWLNSKYIQEMSDADLAKALKPYLDAEGLEVTDEALLAIVPAMKVRLKRLTDGEEMLQFLSKDEVFAPEAEKLAHKKIADPLNAIMKARDLIAGLAEFSVETLSAGLSALGEKVTDNEKAGPFLGLMRYAVTGQPVSPPLYESAFALGKESTLERLDRCIELLK
ncbi:MAG: glutamate--tRNA ligase [Chloroflexi bacterium]|jgi:glutamyl-tRNA synthetase|nr:glutamate--tRNA ligase [Chloroflexota bacterium]MBT3669988.1 glutamate--tRNA ligase [Chloroflexota bacterium]MBT4003900.1 glutamate--tRNA ligase [Chloroflexota bacterium]MBT4306501.1 glutamate--tRNA ligase [Chloroflexota bacterium]MBT4534608.1 glutamate--tRNA ligase [Chloroflexota bacterium]